jgi:hypothetical protein
LTLPRGVGGLRMVYHGDVAPMQEFFVRFALHYLVLWIRPRRYPYVAYT